MADSSRIPTIYAEGLTRKWQFVLGVGLIVINVAAYAAIHYTGRRHEQGT